jgi:SSS family solute:Na+ symporter
VAVKWFVPFYRQSGEISAYYHLEKRFGPWARTYALVCYLLTQLARVGTILFGVSLGLSALTGWSLPAVIIVSGIAVTAYTLLGGIVAVIWTDVIQSIVLLIGAVVIA